MGCSLPRLCALALLVGPLAFAGTLRVGVPVVNGNQVVLPVMLEGDTGAGVAALDFTLNYDPAVFTPVRAEASEAAQTARKQVESNEVSSWNDRGTGRRDYPDEEKPARVEPVCDLDRADHLCLDRRRGDSLGRKQPDCDLSAAAGG